MLRANLIFLMGLILINSICISKEYDVSPLIEPQADALQELPNADIWEDVVSNQNVNIDIFVEAEKITGCPAEILRGIAGVESNFIESAIGDEGLSHGMFQLHSEWYDSRVEKYGKFDPFDPGDAAIIAGYIIQENLRSFDGDLRLAIAAYRQGVAGVLQNGATDWYIDAVLFWRNNPKKVLAFFIFQGITESGRMEDGYIGIGTQIIYRSQADDTPASEVPGRRGSRFPY